jgi:hypothetical protein
MTRERTNEARRRAIERGVLTTPHIIPGYQRGPDRRLVVDEAAAAVVRQAFQMRADGSSWRQVRDFLADHGVVRSMGGVEKLLSSRTVLGELAHGEHVNFQSHPPIVERAVWDAVQRRGPDPRGPKSDRLLAHVGGILRCGSCGGHLSAGTQQRGARKYLTYRCQGFTRKCDYRVAIAGDLLDAHVVERVREVLAAESATASASVDLCNARTALVDAHGRLDRAIEVLIDVQDVATARRKLTQVRALVEVASARVAELERIATLTVTVNAADDWELLTVDERRGLIAAVVRRIVVAPGRGRDRVHIELVSE